MRLVFATPITGSHAVSTVVPPMQASGNLSDLTLVHTYQPDPEQPHVIDRPSSGCSADAFMRHEKGNPSPLTTCTVHYPSRSISWQLDVRKHRSELIAMAARDYQRTPIVLSDSLLGDMGFVQSASEVDRTRNVYTDQETQLAIRWPEMFAVIKCALQCRGEYVSMYAI